MNTFAVTPKKQAVLALAFAMIIASMAILLMVPHANAEEYGDFTYKVNANGTVTITHYSGSDETLAFPSKIEGKTVTSLGNYVLENNKSNIKKIIVPGTIKRIYSLNLSSSTAQEVILEEGVEIISNEALSYFTATEKFSLPSLADYSNSAIAI